MDLARIAIAFALPFLFTCSGDLNPFAEECTLVGCSSFLRVELLFASQLTKDDVQVVVEHSGHSFSCSFGSDDDPCHQGFQPGFDPGSTGNPTHLVVLINESPEQLRITATSSAGSESVLVEPDYQRSQPNGPDCEPTCHSASTTAQFSL
jgi:hypothetical protein